MIAPFRHRWRILRCAALVALALLAVPLRAGAEDLVVFAAASLRGAIDEVAAGWPGGPVTVSYAGSSVLARQIEAGAPADLFLSANTEWMDYLDGAGLIRDGQMRELLGNRLVLAGPADAIAPTGDFAAALRALPDGSRIATGLVEAVPAGIYARQALEALGLYEAFRPRLVQTENVRIALALAARGEVARAIVYATDARAEPGVAVEVIIPEGLHDPIRYPAAVMAQSTHQEAEAFLAHLASPGAAEVFAAHGFEVLP